MRLRRRSVFMSSVILGTCFANSATSGAVQSDQRLTLSVNEGRPVAAAIRTLEKRHGWVITYEDPVYVHPEDIKDVTASVRKDYTPAKPKVLVPRGGTFEFGYTLPGGADAVDPTPVLQRLIDEYGTTGHTGRFRLEKTGNVFHVVPTHFKSVTGALEADRSLLSARITIPLQDRTATEMLQAIAVGVSVPGRTQVERGMFPINLFSQTRVQGGADKETARSVLLRTLQATGKKLSWKIYCDPGLSRTCYLSVLAVPADGEQATDK